MTEEQARKLVAVILDSMAEFIPTAMLTTPMTEDMMVEIIKRHWELNHVQ